MDLKERGEGREFVVLISVLKRERLWSLRLFLLDYGQPRVPELGFSVGVLFEFGKEALREFDGELGDY